MIKSNVLVVAFMALLLAGCSGAPRQSTYVDVHPVIETLSLVTKGKSEQRSLELWQKFVEQNAVALPNKNIQIYTGADASQDFIEQVRKDLKRLGITQKQAEWLPLVSNDNRFDIEIKLIQYHVSTDRCQPKSVLDYNNFGLSGCYVKGARWQSMLAPEKMLPQNHALSTLHSGE